MKISIQMRCGFTLVEMLVVMAIIATLAGLLLPAIFAAREEGRRTVCKSNLVQIGQALTIYANNNNSYLPGYPGYGRPATAFKVASHATSITNYSGHQGVSRHMVLGYSREFVPSTDDLDPGELNFMPVGLGILIMRAELEEPGVLNCASMSGRIPTYYGGAEYMYDSSIWKLLGGKAGPSQLIEGDGRKLHHVTTTASNKVAAVLSSYSYRNTPFYCRTTPFGEDPGSWTYSNDGNLVDAEWELENTKPVVRARFMSPPFKALRTLKGRAVACDSFDYADPSISDTFDRNKGMATFHHKDGYNVLYGDGHVEWYDDSARQIMSWAEWHDTSNYGADNLTISSQSSHKVWNLFDQTADIDVP